MKTKIIIGIVVFIGLLVFASVWSRYAKEKRNTTASTRDIALLCTTDMATQYHIHPELYIVINGEEVPLPANIGIKPNCMNSIHTHDGGGVIHVESPVARDFTLGDFFAVWDKPFSGSQLFEYVTDDSHVLSMTVNGSAVDTFEKTVFRDKDKIVIMYGPK